MRVIFVLFRIFDINELNKLRINIIKDFPRYKRMHDRQISPSSRQYVELYN